MKTRKATLSEVYREAIANKTFLKALRGGPKKMKQELKRRRMSLAPADMAMLGLVITPPSPKPGPPPPPPWQPDFGIVSVILTALNSHILGLEKKVVSAKARASRVRR